MYVGSSQHDGEIIHTRQRSEELQPPENKLHSFSFTNNCIAILKCTESLCVILPSCHSLCGEWLGQDINLQNSSVGSLPLDAKGGT